MSEQKPKEELPPDVPLTGDASADFPDEPVGLGPEILVAVENEYAGEDTDHPQSSYEHDDTGAEEQPLPELDEQLYPRQDSLRVYLQQIGKVALLNAEQEVDLAKRIEAGLTAGNLLADADISAARRRDLQRIVQDGARAKNHLLEANLRLVVSLARRYTGNGMAYLDLIQEGNLGLIRAVEKFDYTKGYKFSTYATWWIRQACRRALDNQARTIRIPVEGLVDLRRLGRIRGELAQDLGREPTPGELSAEMDLPPEKIMEMQQDATEPMSLDKTLAEDTTGTLHDKVGQPAPDPAHAIISGQMQDQLRNVLLTFSDLEAGVVELRFGLKDGNPHTLEEIAQAYDITRERVRKVLAKTMDKLRHPSRRWMLYDYL